MAARQITATQTLEDFRTQFNALSATDFGDIATLDSNLSATSVIGAVNELYAAIAGALSFTISDGSNTQTLVNGNTILFQSTANQVTATVSATLTINANTIGTVAITAQDSDFTIALPTGSPKEGQKLIIRIKDDGTGRSITYNAIFRAIGITLPTTTIASKVLYLGCMFNSAETKWDVIAVKQEA